MGIITDHSAIVNILRDARTIAVVGLSDRPERDSFGVARYLLSQKYTIIPVNPLIPSVFGLPAVPDLEHVHGSVDIVDIFRRPEFVPEIVESAIRIHAGTVWMQAGIVHQEAAERASAAGLNVIMDRCIMVEHRFR